MNSKEFSLCVRWLVEHGRYGDSNNRFSRSFAKSYLKHLDDAPKREILREAKAAYGNEQAEERRSGHPSHAPATKQKSKRAPLLQPSQDKQAVNRAASEKKAVRAAPSDTALVDQGQKKPRGRPPSEHKKKLVSVNLTPKQVEQLRAVSDVTGEPVAFHIRQAIGQYLEGFEHG